MAADSANTASNYSTEGYAASNTPTGYTNPSSTAGREPISGYPQDSTSLGQRYPASQSYSKTGNASSVNSGAPAENLTHASKTERLGSSYTPSNTAGGYSTQSGQDVAGYGHARGYTSAQSDAPAATDSMTKRLSKGPNEGTGISSGLGTAGITGTGNQVYEGGLTRGFQDGGDTRIVDDHSRAYTGTGAGQGNTTSTSGSQAARDTTEAGTAATAAQGSHLRQQNARDNIRSQTGQNTSAENHRFGDDAAGYRTSGQGSHLHRQTGRDNLASDASYSTAPAEQSSGHHLGRDAAVAGGVGAAGAGLYAHENDKTTGSSTGYTGNSTGGASGAYAPYGNAIPGPHSTHIANLLDPTVNTSGKGHIEDSHYHSRSHGGGAEAADKFHGRKATSSNAGTSSTQR